jgi:SAM-dependent methyltransferase
MNFTDKRGIIPHLQNRGTVILELGCGQHKRFPDSIAIDIVDSDEVDIVCNLDEGLGFLADESVDVIYSFHFLEHLNDLGFFMKEIYRVLKKGGRKIGTVPHFSNPYYFSDYTHKTPFGLYTFCYFAGETPFRRKVLKYDPAINFRINRMKIIFYSPFRTVNIFRKIHGLIFNSSICMQEFYEGSLSTHIPAHELSFELEKV